MTDSISGYLESAVQAGLSGKASAVYVALLEAGVALAPKNIISRSRLHRQYVYDALQELKDKRLITSAGSGRKIKYMAVSPDLLLQEAEKRRIDVLEGVQSLMRLYDKSPAGLVEVIRGSQAAIEEDFKMLREAHHGDFLDIIGGGGMNWVHLFDGAGRMEEFEAMRREKSIKIRYIGTAEDVRFNREESISENESRTIPNITDVITVVIRPGSVTFNIYQPEIVYVRIRNDAAVKSQRALFEILWNAAEKYG
jgi:hypothetical protein